MNPYNIFTSLRKAPRALKGLPLSGTKAAIKDNICTTKEPTTCSSEMLRDYVSPFNATVVELLEKNGSSIVGKTNMDEFGMGGNNTYSAFGTTLNPRFKTPTSAGGSSGGLAAAVAANMADFALGTDTGGSVRLPAAYCGVVGFKPLYGRLSRWGVIPYAQSLDTVGILASSVDLVRRVYQVLDKEDPKDITCLTQDQRTALAHEQSRLKGLSINIGLSKEYLAKGVSESILKSIAEICERLLKKGKVNVYEVSLPSLPISVPAYFTLAYSEAASNLGRYDGVRYGLSEVRAEDYRQFIAKTRGSGFGNEVQKRILVGNYNLSSEKLQDNFLKAQKVRSQLISEFDGIFKMQNVLRASQRGAETSSTEKVDLIVAPVSATGAPSLELFHKAEKEDPISNYANDSFLIPANMARLPAISIPLKNDSVQIIGQYGDDLRVLDFAEEVLLLDI